MMTASHEGGSGGGANNGCRGHAGGGAIFFHVDRLITGIVAANVRPKLC